MALTVEEKTLVTRWLRNYPAGIDSDSWGYGPFEGTREDDEFAHVDPEDVAPEVCREFG